MKSGKRLALHVLLPLAALAAAALALYGSFLRNPLVFDDYGIFSHDHPEYFDAIFLFRPRGLAYATFEWTRHFVNEDLLWQRAGNLLLHVANAWLLFLLLRRLYGLVAVEGGGREGEDVRLAWLAFFGALLFVLHPAAVYGVAYLVQRTILMATMFALATLLLFLEGLVRGRQRLLLASALTYLLAGLAKEHAVMVPAAAFALMLLVRKPERRLWREVGLTFVLYAAAGAHLVYQVKQGNVIGNTYEPNSVAMLDVLGIAPRYFYPLSVLTQSALFFKYLLLWLFPNPAWMAVDIRAEFADSFWRWPQAAGFAVFLLYGAAAAWLLLKRGRLGLLGFALLCPWLMFAVELSTVRVQEIFVIYRSYLWMPCLVAALPFLLQKLPLRLCIVLLAGITSLLVPAAWNRLTTFSDPALLWNDAMRLALEHPHPASLGRIYHNRGLAYLNRKQYDKAIEDFNRGLELLPQHTLLYNDRAVAYLETGRYMGALNDFDSAIWYDPNYYNPYLGRAQTYEALGNMEAAKKDYEISCELGVKEVCGWKPAK